MKTKTNITRILIPFLIVIAIFTGYKLTNQKVVEMHGLYPMYSDFNTLLEKSDTVIIGKVISVDKGFVVNKHKKINGDKAKELVSKIKPRLYAYTPSKVKIEQVIKGDLSENDMIRINQEGGSYDNVYYKIDGNKIYKNNDTYVFFLRKVKIDNEQDKKDFKEDFYLPINPLQGQLKIESDMVLTNTELNPMYKSEKISKNDFIGLIKSHLK